MRPSKNTIATAGTNIAPLSALQLTRLAILRWSGKLPPTKLQRTPFRVSAQARHLAQAQRGLAEWIAQGGFSQNDEMVMPDLAFGPACSPLSNPMAQEHIRIACLD